MRHIFTLPFLLLWVRGIIITWKFREKHVSFIFILLLFSLLTCFGCSRENTQAGGNNECNIKELRCPYSLQLIIASSRQVTYSAGKQQHIRYFEMCVFHLLHGGTLLARLPLQQFGKLHETTWEQICRQWNQNRSLPLSFRYVDILIHAT